MPSVPTIDREFTTIVQTFGHPNLKLALSSVDVIIDIHDSDDIQVQTREDSVFNRLKIDFSGDTIVINEVSGADKHQQLLRVIIPVGTPIDISTHSSVITIADTRSSIRASITGHGSITAMSVHDMDVALSSSGWIRASSVTGTIVAELTDTAFVKIDTADCTTMHVELSVSSRIEVLAGSVETLEIASSRNTTLMFDGAVAHLKMRPCCAGDVDISEIRVIDGEGE
ncbi:MAG: DUF2807 domain-containing protein [Candidatus Saccharimonadales bacterium]